MSDGIHFYDITPTPAPRQSRRDKWKPSPAVLRYRAFRDEVGLKIKELPMDFFHVVFLLEIPRSFSDVRRTKMIGRPHQQTPDKDNLEKALIDAVYRGTNDAFVWNTASTKLWASRPGIIIADDYLPFYEIPVDVADLVRGSWEVHDRVIV